MTDEYILVSAYCGVEGYKTELKLNSFSQGADFVKKGDKEYLVTSSSPKGITIIDFDKILEIKKNEKVSKHPNISKRTDFDADRKKYDYDSSLIIEDDDERE